MRPLLVLSPQALDTALAQLLHRHQWTLRRAADADGARTLLLAEPALVGLVLLTEDAGPDWTAAAVRLIQALHGMRWVAVMASALTQEPALRRLIAESLYDYQVQPVDPLRLCHALGHAYGIARIEQGLLGDPTGDQGRFGMIGTSAVMQQLYRRIERAARTDVPVLITGPTGSGKALVARAVHQQSTRAQGPLVSLNCAAIPAPLIESELFGYAEGAFPDAPRDRPGLLERAAGGSLFLDEIGELPLGAQASLLRFLDDHRVSPPGGAGRSRTLNLRIIAATNRELEAAVAQQQFRADLLFRLSVLTLRTPPLQGRGADLERLAKLFLEQARERFSVVPIGFSAPALAALHRHHWPGNVRELRSRVYQAALDCTRRYITPNELGLRRAQPLTTLRPLAEVRDEAERALIAAALDQLDGDVRAVAGVLDVSPMTLNRLIEKHGLRVTAPPVRDA